MIEAILSLFALLGAGVGDADKPKHTYLEPSQQEIIRAIDSDALKGFDHLQSHDANRWFV